MRRRASRPRQGAHRSEIAAAEKSPSLMAALSRSRGTGPTRRPGPARARAARGPLPGRTGLPAARPSTTSNIRAGTSPLRSTRSVGIRLSSSPSDPVSDRLRWPPSFAGNSRPRRGLGAAAERRGCSGSRPRCTSNAFVDRREKFRQFLRWEEGVAECNGAVPCQYGHDRIEGLGTSSREVVDGARDGDALERALHTESPSDQTGVRRANGFAGAADSDRRQVSIRDGPHLLPRRSGFRGVHVEVFLL